MKNKISQERKKDLKKVKRKKLLVIATQLIILIGFLVIWEALANAKIIDSFITSQPSRIWSTFTHLTSNDLLKHIKVTVYAQNGNIIRTALNIGTDNITIEKTLKNNKYILSIRAIFSSTEQFAQSCTWSNNHNLGPDQARQRS